MDSFILECVNFSLLKNVEIGTSLPCCSMLKHEMTCGTGDFPLNLDVLFMASERGFFTTAVKN